MVHIPDRPNTGCSRRSYLTAIGSGTTALLAGCLGGSPTPETTYDCDLTAPEPVSDLPHPTLGPDDATVTVDVFSDFACPHCRDFALGTLADLRENYLQTSDTPAVRFRHFDAPIPVNDWSRPVANAARFIQDQHGDDAFFAFSTLAYNNQADYSWQRLGNLAEELAVDAAPCETISAASNATYDGVIDADKATAENRDIPGTPTIFVNNTQVDSEYQNISDAIEKRT